MTSQKKRIYELAKEFNISSNAMLTVLRELGFTPKSHMSVATEEHVKAVTARFAQKKQEAKKEMEQRQAAQSAKTAQATDSKAATRIGGIKVDDSKSSVAGVMRRIEKKQKRKDRRKRKGRNVVDKVEVAKSFKSTMATLDKTKGKRRYRRTHDESQSVETGPSNVIEVNEFMSLAELGKAMDHRPAELIAKLFEMGMMATINQRLDLDTIEMLASEFDFEIRQIAEVGDEKREEEDEGALVPRAPVVTVMGHVDHGKTSLLDYIRKTDVASGEAGAITQHIGAYEVHLPNGRITFLDTPGHEAFTAMRARGSQITDILVLVVAADDGVQPQTIEAIDHGRAANVPIIVAVNKIDKPSINLDNVKTQLANHNLSPEEWGGKTIMVNVSAKTGEGVDKLLEMILLQAEMMDLKADPDIRAQGIVVDAHLEKGRGPVVTVLIQRGQCKIGDSIVTGTYYGRIRTAIDDHNRPMHDVGPSRPLQITGLNGVPQAGDSFMVVASDQEAKEIAGQRDRVKREQDARRTHGRLSLDRVFDRIKEGQIKNLPLIIKGDVDGSVEVLSDTLGKISTNEVQTQIIHRGVGAITESDVMLAAASNAIIIGFQVSADMRAREVARIEKVDIRSYDIIYEAEDDIKKALEGLLAPTITEKFVGMAEVRDVFKIPKIGAIAGSYVKQGRFERSNKVRLVRDGKVIYTGNIGSLKRFKDDAKEVKEGLECGIGIENYNDVKVGDTIEAFELVEEARKL